MQPPQTAAVAFWLWLLPALLVSPPAAHAAAAIANGQSPAGATGRVAGVVVDARTGLPLDKVLVQIVETDLAAVTDPDGRFELDGVPAGRRSLFVSLIGYSLTKREIQVQAGVRMDVTVPLSEGTGTYTEDITVTGAVFRTQEPAVPAEQVLGSAELQNLRGVIADDPLRAVQALPGVATGDDLRSEFSVRGSDFRHMGFSFDGVATPFLLHTVRQIQETGAGGSIAMINSDILDDVTLLSGAYPQRYGNRTGAEVDFHMREGSRERRQTRAVISGTSASVVVEGPMGSGRNGSWLVSARKSYLDLIIDRISDSEFNFPFSDLQSKLAYDLTPRHRLELTVVAGRSRLEERPENTGVGDVLEGRNSAGVINLAWRFVPQPRLMITQRAYVTLNGFRNTNRDGVELDAGGGRELSYRADVSYASAPGLTYEGGAQARFGREDRREMLFDGRTATFRPGNAYVGSATAASAYAQVRWTMPGRMTTTAGARADRWTLTADTTASPWIQVEWPLGAALSLKAGAGVYQQFPDFEHALGMRGSRELRPERAYHTDLSVERALGDRGRVQVTIYNRAERDMLRLPDTEPRLFGGIVRLGSRTTRYENALRGYARGIELRAERKSPNGFSGWGSYSLGYNRYRDDRRQEVFWGDFDQRHTLNLYAFYRFSTRLSVSAKFRAGSNVPMPAYLQRLGDAYFLSERRNQLRLPAYSRLDLRANRTFNWTRKRLTLFVEIANVYNRENVRFNPPGINTRTGQAFGVSETMLPIVPSAGLLLEF